MLGGRFQGRQCHPFIARCALDTRAPIILFRWGSLRTITKHRTISMVAHYTREANQKQMATAAIRKFDIAVRKGGRTMGKP